MKKILENLMGALIALAALVVLFGLIDGGQPSAIAAAWVQAVGSIIAIGATAYYARLPIQAAEVRRQEERRDRITAIADSVGISLAGLEAARTAIRTESRDAFSHARATFDPHTTIALTAMTKLSVEQWPSAVFYTQTLALKLMIDAFSKVIAEAKLPFYAEPNEWALMLFVDRDLVAAEDRYRASLRDLTPSQKLKSKSHRAAA